MTSRIPARVRIVLAAAGVIALAPFNMGGCSDITSQIGQTVGGPSGHWIETGGKAAEQGSAAMANESDEKAIGESVAMEITARYTIVKDRDLNNYVALVGLTLAGNSSRPDANWLFAVVETDEVNAFSGPDGYILVTRGAVRQMRDESELAGVLAHEMNHVLKHHGLEAVKRAGIAGFGGALASGARESAPFAKVAGGAVDVVLIKGYGRDEENAADAGAVQLLIATGYDPAGYERFIGRLGAKQARQSGLFATHPGAAERAVSIRKQIDSSKGSEHGAVLKERFEKMTAKGPA